MLTEWELPLHSFLIWLPIRALLVHRGDSWDSLQRERRHSSGGHPAQSPSHRGHLIFPNKLPQACVLAPLQHQGNLAKNPFQHSFPSPTAWGGLLLLGEFIDSDAPRE